MAIKAFFKKFVDTYNETYEIEKKLLMEKQHEQIDSFKVSVSMGQNLDEKEILKMAQRYVSFISNKDKRPKIYIFFRGTPNLVIYMPRKFKV